MGRPLDLDYQKNIDVTEDVQQQPKEVKTKAKPVFDEGLLGMGVSDLKRLLKDRNWKDLAKWKEMVDRLKSSFNTLNRWKVLIGYAFIIFLSVLYHIC